MLCYSVIFVLLVHTALGQFGGNYRPFPRPPQPQPQPQYNAQQYNQPGYRPQGPVIAIRSQHSDASPDGSYQYGYETENGISVEENGTPNGPASPEGKSEVVRGRYSYTAPDGTPIVVEYYADDTGFHPTGSHIPTPPPAIQRALAAIPNDQQTYQDDRFASNSNYKYNNYNRRY